MTCTLSSMKVLLKLLVTFAPVQNLLMMLTRGLLTENPLNIRSANQLSLTLLDSSSPACVMVNSLTIFAFFFTHADVRTRKIHDFVKVAFFMIFRTSECYSCSMCKTLILPPTLVASAMELVKSKALKEN